METPLCAASICVIASILAVIPKWFPSGIGKDHRRLGDRLVTAYPHVSNRMMKARRLLMYVHESSPEH